MDWFLYAWPTLILLAIGVRMALRLLYGARGPNADDHIYDLLSICSWVMLAIGLVPAVLAGLFSLVGVLIVIMAAVTLVEIALQRRAAQRRSNARLFSLYLERKQKFDASVLLSAHAFRGSAGRAAAAIFAALDRGVPFMRAVRQHPRALPRQAIAYLAAGGSSTSQASALRELSQVDDAELSILWRSVIDRVTYVSSVLLVMSVILTFVMIKIVPAYSQIFAEFEIELPALTLLVVAFSNFVVNYFAAPLVLAGVALFVTGMVIWLCYLCDFAVLQPISDRIFRGRRTADILRALAVAAEQRTPIHEALGRIALTYPSPTISRRLRPAVTAIEAGQPWQDALHAARVVSPAEAALLKAAQRTGGLDWTFRQIARRRDKRSVYRLATWINVVYPLAIVLLGTVIAFFVVGLFVPIAQLIHGLAR